MCQLLHHMSGLLCSPAMMTSNQRLSMCWFRRILQLLFFLNLQLNCIGIPQGLSRYFHDCILLFCLPWFRMSYNNRHHCQSMSMSCGECSHMCRLLCCTLC